MARYWTIVLAAAALASGARAQAIEKKSLASAAAKRAVAACEAMASANHWTETIAVVDEAGDLLAFLKMDRAALNTIDFAMGKAKAALRVQAPSSDLIDRLNKGQTSVLNWGLLPSRGGFPIRLGAEVIGAIGVSGAGSAEDERCAQAGVEAALKGG
jgi:uncharacterized protein GlcG (DUF336 family)